MGRCASRKITGKPALGRELALSNDVLNRMTLVNEPFGQTMTMVYDNIGNRTEVQDGTGVEDSIYDAHNNLTSRTYSQSGTAVVHFQQTFDALDRVTGQSRYASGSPGRWSGQSHLPAMNPQELLAAPLPLDK